MGTSRRVRGLAMESLERRIYLSADPISLSQWQSQAWCTGSVSEQSGTIVVAANGQSQGGDHVALTDSPAVVDSDLYLEFTPQVNHLGNDKVVFEISNGSGTRVVINLERNDAGNLFSITEQEGYGAPSYIQTVTITNNTSHRLEMNVDEASFTLFIDQLPLATYPGQLAANSFVRLCVRGDREIAQLQLTGLGGMFSDYTSSLGESGEASDPADPLDASLWQQQTWSTGQVSSTDSQISLSANGGAQGGDHVVILQSPAVPGDFFLDILPSVNYAAANADSDKVLVEIGNGTTSRHTVNLVRDSNGDLYTIVETTDPEAQISQVTITNGQSHRLEVNATETDFSVFVDESLVAAFSEPLAADAFVRLGLRGDKALAQVSLTGLNGVFTPYTSELIAGAEPQIIELFALVTLDAAVLPVVEVPSFVASLSAPAPTVPSMGTVETASFAQRIARSITSANTIARTGRTYYDADYGVDVYAGSNQYFVEYNNGAVELRVIPSGLPAGQDHPFVHEVTPILRNTADVGQVAKPVSRTGATFYDPARGIDVYAGEGKYLIEYTDGTIEERNRPSGGYIPLPEDFTVGGSDYSEPMSAFGPSAQVLGLSTDGTSPKSSSELYYIGPSYVSNSGQQRIAGPGQVFLQDPVTKTILLRPVADGDVALQRPVSPVVTIATHPATVITDLFQQTYGRTPTSEELSYWRQRTDKSGDSLLGAMEYAHQQSVDATITQLGLIDSSAIGYFDSESPMSAYDLPEFHSISQVPVAEFVVSLNLGLIDRDQAAATIYTHIEELELWWNTTVQTHLDAFSLWKNELSFVPPSPVSMEALSFYINSPDYVVTVDSLPSFVTGSIHDGASTSIRIRRIGSITGTQVTLDASGNIIQVGEQGAGSDDMISPTSTPGHISLIDGARLWGHVTLDVLPWLIFQ